MVRVNVTEVLDGNYYRLILQFDATSALTTNLSFAFHGDLSWFFLDNVSLVDPSPEPSSLAIAAACGVLGSLYFFHRGRQALAV